MPVKVLMASRYAQPDIKFSNANVYRQAMSLKNDHGVEVEVLTWPFNDGWTGPVPDKAIGLEVQPLHCDAGGLVYHVINPPDQWNNRILHPYVWDEAVSYGIQILEKLRPDVVHLQHWSGLWWLLESAQQLNIPTVYSNHDWGISCLRTTLVMGDDTLCDGKLSVEKCARCIWQGRGFIGKVNELTAETTAGRWLIEAIYRSPLKSIFERNDAVRIPVRERLELNFTRERRVLSRLDAMFTPSDYGRAFFSRRGVPVNRIQVKPWYHDPIETCKTTNRSQPFTITYIGRVSPEKGIHLILEALGNVNTSESIRLRIAGANDSKYCVELQQKYATRAGGHEVEWLGWSEVEPLFLSTDVIIIPSAWIDNTPLTLVEALSYRVPVIATRVPPIEELVIDGQNGYLAEYNSVESLTAAIQRAAADQDYIRSDSMPFPKMSTRREYTLAIKNMYLSITGPRRIYESEKEATQNSLGIL